MSIHMRVNADGDDNIVDDDSGLSSEEDGVDLSELTSDVFAGRVHAFASSRPSSAAASHSSRPASAAPSFHSANGSSHNLRRSSRPMSAVAHSSPSPSPSFTSSASNSGLSSPSSYHHHGHQNHVSSGAQHTSSSLTSASSSSSASSSASSASSTTYTTTRTHTLSSSAAPQQRDADWILRRHNSFQRPPSAVTVRDVIPPSANSYRPSPSAQHPMDSSRPEDMDEDAAQNLLNGGGVHPFHRIRHRSGPAAPNSAFASSFSAAPYTMGPSAQPNHQNRYSVPPPPVNENYKVPTFIKPSEFEKKLQEQQEQQQREQQMQVQADSPPKQSAQRPSGFIPPRPGAPIPPASGASSSNASSHSPPHGSSSSASSSSATTAVVPAATLEQLKSTKPWLDARMMRAIAVSSALISGFDFRELPPGDHSSEMRYISSVVRPRIDAVREKKTDLELLDDARYYGKYGDFLRQRFERRNFFERLGVSQQADVKEIKVAYRKMCMDWHPDSIRRSGRVLFAHEQKFVALVTEIFRHIDEAYRCLVDDTQRIMYQRRCTFLQGARS